MRQREIASSGLVVSVVGLGCNNFGARMDYEATRAVVDAAIEAGITFFDTAESYGNGESEAFLGRCLTRRRDQVVIATKFGWWNENSRGARGSPAYLRAAIEASLARLGTDYIDLYQYHRPDGVTPIEETLGAMDELVREGKVRFIGSSNMNAEEVTTADGVAREHGFSRFISAQNEYSWLVRTAEAELIPACERLNIGLIPYFPLASGLLTGKYRRDVPPGDGTRLAAGIRLTGSSEMPGAAWDRLESLSRFAKDNGGSLLDIAIGGLAANPVVASVIAGATKPEQVRSNAAAGAWVPSPDVLAQLRAL